jgi:hypothetical protein
MPYIPPPRSFRAFPLLVPSKPKTAFGGGLRKRWTDADGSIFEWDYRHGCLEKYDGLGRHLGEFDPQSGKQVKIAAPNRRIEP